MTKADKMFQELGYELNEETNYSRALGMGAYLNIDFSDNFRQYWKTHRMGWKSYPVDIYLDEHLAIHEKMKEVGVFND